MRTRSLWFGLPLVVVGCAVGGGPASDDHGTSASTSSALSAASAAPRVARRPHLRTAAPLARNARNPLLQKGGDPGDDDTAISLAPSLSALCQSYVG